MLSDRNRSYLSDILEAIKAIHDFTHGMDADSFALDEKSKAAVEFKLLVLSEAAHRLGSEAQTLCPGIPWADVRGIGNWIRHQYDKMDAGILWETVERDLPVLKSAVDKALATPSD